MIWCYWEERLCVGGSWFGEIWFDVFEKDIINKAERAEAPPACKGNQIYNLINLYTPYTNIIAAIVTITTSNVVRCAIICIVFDSK